MRHSLLALCSFGRYLDLVFKHTELMTPWELFALALVVSVVTIPYYFSQPLDYLSEISSNLLPVVFIDLIY